MSKALIVSFALFVSLVMLSLSNTASADPQIGEMKWCEDCKKWIPDPGTKAVQGVVSTAKKSTKRKNMRSLGGAGAGAAAAANAGSGGK